jgi:hypothetical protein
VAHISAGSIRQLVFTVGSKLMRVARQLTVERPHLSQRTQEMGHPRLFMMLEKWATRLRLIQGCEVF